MRAHEAGALHGDIGTGAGLAAYARQDVNALVPAAVAAHGRRAAPTARWPSAGLDVRDLAAEFGTPAYVLDEDDLRPALPRLPGGLRRRRTSTTPARRSCAGRWSGSIAEEGLYLDVCTGGELATALAAGMPPERIGFHGNNKSIAELTRGAGRRCRPDRRRLVRPRSTG